MTSKVQIDFPEQPLHYSSLAEWRFEGARRFGLDPMRWRFVCPACGHVASVQDWKDAGAPVGAAAFSCVGRWLVGSRKAFPGWGNGPCDYSGGGLFRLNPIRIQGIEIGPFAFADADAAKAQEK